MVENNTPQLMDVAGAYLLYDESIAHICLAYQGQGEQEYEYRKTKQKNV
jgi:hypothetical protein